MRLLLLILLSLLSPAARAAAADDAIVTSYQLYSKGLRVGTVRTERSRIVTNGVEAIRCEVATRVHVNLLILRHDLDGREVYVSDGSGPIEYRNTKRENGRTTDVVGVRGDGVFRLVIAEEATVRTNAFRDDDYEAVSMDGPELELANEGDEKTLRVLDLGAAEVVDRTYRWTKSDGDYRVVDFSDRNKSARRWVRADALGMLIARQDGRDRAGTYSMRMADPTAPP
jgi:hypothetical protein